MSSTISPTSGSPSHRKAATKIGRSEFSLPLSHGLQRPFSNVRRSPQRSRADLTGTVGFLDPLRGYTGILARAAGILDGGSITFST